nr:uncharacterized protein LOC109167340 [Ipomoea batatas]
METVLSSGSSGERGDDRQRCMTPSSPFKRLTNIYAGQSKKQRVGRHGFPIDKSRVSSTQYVNAVQKFTPTQREAVEEMGFGRFLDLQIKLFPTELSYALLKSYNPMNGKLTLRDGLMLDMTEDDVAAVLGFPWGIVEIERKKKGVSFLLHTEFKEKIQVGDAEKVTYSGLIEATLECKDGGVWFKCYFMVLMLYYLDNVFDIPRFNWCSFVMHTLMETSVEWLKKESEYFHGPLLFLLVIRVVLFRRHVPRAFPVFIGWTSDLLKDREKEEINHGGLCQGRIEARYAPTATDLALVTGNVQGPSPTDHEVQPQRQASTQVELECPTSSKVQIGPVDKLQYVNAVQKFTPTQREAVEEMGFGRFLDLQIKLFPTELSYALLKSYNPMNGKLTLRDGLMLDMTEDDVAAVLGFPWGIVEIERKKKGVIRVVLFRRHVPRAFPVFIGWTSDLLKDREKEEINHGGLCQGRIEARYAPTATDLALVTGNVQGPSPTDHEVQPQRQASTQVELECPTSSKVQIGPVDKLQETRTGSFATPVQNFRTDAELWSIRHVSASVRKPEQTNRFGFVDGEEDGDLDLLMELWGWWSWSFDVDGVFL